MRHHALSVFVLMLVHAVAAGADQRPAAATLDTHFERIHTEAERLADSWRGYELKPEVERAALRAGYARGLIALRSQAQAHFPLDTSTWPPTYLVPLSEGQRQLLEGLERAVRTLTVTQGGDAENPGAAARSLAAVESSLRALDRQQGRVPRRVRGTRYERIDLGVADSDRKLRSIKAEAFRLANLWKGYANLPGIQRTGVRAAFDEGLQVLLRRVEKDFPRQRNMYREVIHPDRFEAPHLTSEDHTLLRTIYSMRGVVAHAQANAEAMGPDSLLVPKYLERGLVGVLRKDTRDYFGCLRSYDGDDRLPLYQKAEIEHFADRRVEARVRNTPLPSVARWDPQTCSAVIRLGKDRRR